MEAGAPENVKRLQRILRAAAALSKRREWPDSCAPLPGGNGSLRVIADEFAGAKGPAKAFRPIHVWNLHLQSGLPFCIPLPDGYIALLAVLHSLSMSR
jgi:redox-sensitive bicupin YhaK (pirin superfamily)